MSTVSKFVWHDLMSLDVEKSKRFYGEMFNWRIWAGKDGGPYLHLSAGEKDIGGMMPLDAKHGAPSHWVGYISTDNVDEVVTKTTQAGGKLLVGAMDMPRVGRFALVQDPQGGVFSPFKSSTDMTSPGDPKRAAGEFCWDELVVADPAAAVAFYGGIFGWTHETMAMPEGGTYYVLKAGADNVAGVMKTPKGAPAHGHWITYVAVDDTDAARERVSKLGGRPLSEAMTVPNVGRFAYLMDDGKTAFAVMGPGK